MSNLTKAYGVPLDMAEVPNQIGIWSGDLKLTNTLQGACYVAACRRDWSKVRMRVDGVLVEGEAVRSWIEEHAPVTLARVRRVVTDV